jgi:hypothetical protein
MKRDYRSRFGKRRAVLSPPRVGLLMRRRREDTAPWSLYILEMTCRPSLERVGRAQGQRSRSCNGALTRSRDTGFRSGFSAATTIQSGVARGTAVPRLPPQSKRRRHRKTGFVHPNRNTWDEAAASQPQALHLPSQSQTHWPLDAKNVQSPGRGEERTPHPTSAAQIIDQLVDHPPCSINPPGYQVEREILIASANGFTRQPITTGHSPANNFRSSSLTHKLLLVHLKVVVDCSKLVEERAILNRARSGSSQGPLSR